MEIILYSDDTGVILDENSERLCGFELWGGRKRTICINLSTDVDFFGKNTTRIFLNEGYAYDDFGDAWDKKTEKGIAYEKKEQGSEIHYLLYSKAANRTSKKKAKESAIKGKQTFAAIKTVEEAEKQLNNTIWTYTESMSTSQIEFWFKLCFKNGQYELFVAKPADGEWGKWGHFTGAYKVKESRYSNTGGKFILVELADAFYGLSFDLTGGTISVGFGNERIYGEINYGDYKWD